MRGGGCPGSQPSCGSAQPIPRDAPPCCGCGGRPWAAALCPPDAARQAGTLAGRRVRCWQPHAGSSACGARHGGQHEPGSGGSGRRLWALVRRRRPPLTPPTCSARLPRGSGAGSGGGGAVGAGLRALGEVQASRQDEARARRPSSRLVLHLIHALSVGSTACIQQLRSLGAGAPLRNAGALPHLRVSVLNPTWVSA